MNTRKPPAVAGGIFLGGGVVGWGTRQPVYEKSIVGGSEVFVF